jgi:catechol 2,3-dioxygenase-like lactoylglutathione lyase family enzyme
MKIQLHEIEFGVSDTNASRDFYQALPGYGPGSDQEGLDFNVLVHLPPPGVVASFICDDLPA